MADLPNYAQARALYERILALSKEVFDESHPYVAPLINNLGGVLKAHGDLEGAKAGYERALNIFREFLGDNHPNTKTVKRNLELHIRSMKERL
jgi:tetratricopeptide (TPR) repeat protein